MFVASLLSRHEDSATVQVIRRWIVGDVILLYSHEILAEYREVLCRKKFSFPAEERNFFLAAVEKFGLVVSPDKSAAMLPDPKDLPFYETFVAKRGAYLVTGKKKHFPINSFIVSPSEMLQILKKK